MFIYSVTEPSVKMFPLTFNYLDVNKAIKKAKELKTHVVIGWSWI